MYVMIGIFLAVDIIFLTVWQIVDPLERDIEEQTKKIIPDRDLEIQPQLEHCEAKKFEIWLGECIALLHFIRNILKPRNLKGTRSLFHHVWVWQPF